MRLLTVNCPCWCSSGFPHWIFVSRLYSLLVYNGSDDTLNIFFLENSYIVLGTLFIAAALDKFDVFEVVNLWDDDVFLEIGSPYFHRFTEVNVSHCFDQLINLKPPFTAYVSYPYQKQTITS